MRDAEWRGIAIMIARRRRGRGTGRFAGRNDGLVRCGDRKRSVQIVLGR